MDLIDLKEKYERLRSRLKDLGSVLVAYSGGVDSTLLLKVAKGVLGKDLLAVTALSPTMTLRERDEAVRLAGIIGVDHLCVETPELSDPAFVQNSSERCYVCKKIRYGRLLDLAGSRGLAWIVDGENADDSADYRPGTRAAREMGIISPLAEVGLGKAEIRQLARDLSLPNWNKPAAACLASRIPYYQPITAEKLGQTEAAEEYLVELGLSPQLRVRHYGDTARLELAGQDISRLMDEGLRFGVVRRLKDLGFKFITLDLEGYRTGSLNIGLELAASRK